MRPMLSLLLLALLAVAAPGCKQKEDDYLGPDLNDIYGPFSVIAPLKAEADSVDFGQGGRLFFTGKLSKTIDWRLTLTGLSSGAQRFYTGKSKDLRLTDLAWDGTTSQLPLFRAEVVEARLTFAGVPDTLRDTITVTAPRALRPAASLLLADFENGVQPGWLLLPSAAPDSSVIALQRSNAPQGESYLSISGRESGQGDYYLGQVQFPATAIAGGAAFYPISTTAGGTYFNVMVFGAGRGNTRLAIQFSEDDNRANNGQHDPNADDVWATELTVDWRGWRLVSLRYADLALLQYAGAPGTNGNRRKEPSAITNITFLLTSNPPGYAAGPAVTAFDYPIFTANQPLLP